MSSSSSSSTPAGAAAGYSLLNDYVTAGASTSQLALDSANAGVKTTALTEGVYSNLVFSATTTTGPPTFDNVIVLVYNHTNEAFQPVESSISKAFANYMNYNLKVDYLLKRASSATLNSILKVPAIPLYEFDTVAQLFGENTVGQPKEMIASVSFYNINY